MAFFEFLELPQMQRAFAIGALAGPMGGLLGTFITLRGMSFFSDAVAHSAMTGVTLGLALNLAPAVDTIPMQICVVVFCVAVALLMVWVFERTPLHADTVIAFSYTGSVALGVVLISKLRGFRVLESVLFGDILAASPADVWLVALLALATVAFLLCNLRGLTLTIVDDRLARLAGVNTRRLSYCFVIVVAVVVALLLRHLGALLISGLIVVPAAAARIVAPSFRGMLLLSAFLGGGGAISGVFASYQVNTPTGPTIVLVDVLILVLCLVIAQLRSKHFPSSPFEQVAPIERT